MSPDSPHCFLHPPSIPMSGEGAPHTSLERCHGQEAGCQEDLAPNSQEAKLS